MAETVPPSTLPLPERLQRPETGTLDSDESEGLPLAGLTAYQSPDQCEHGGGGAAPDPRRGQSGVGSLAIQIAVEL